MGEQPQIKDQRLQVGVGTWRKCALLVGMEIGVATMENSMKVPQKIKNKTII